jgi:DNA-binding IclR family transcriptional regulator
MKSVSLTRVKSADRTLDLFEALAASPTPLTAGELSRTLGIPRSSLFHLAGTLIERGYLSLDDENRYHLTPRLGALARGLQPAKDMLHHLNPLISHLRDEINETFSFNVARADQIEVVITHAGNQSLSYSMRTGDLAPFYAVSAGKVVLAAMTADELDQYLGRVKYEAFTANTIQTHDRLLREIERVRSDGFGYVDEEFTPGIFGVAIGVKVEGRLIGAINVAIPKARVDAPLLSKLRQRLRVAASKAEALLARR